MISTWTSTAPCSPAERNGRCHPPLLVFADDWGRHPSSCQHLVRRLLDHRDVYWVNTIGTRRPRLDLATARRGLEKLCQWVRTPRASGAEPANPRVLSPRMWPWFSTPFDRRLNRALLRKRLGPLVASLSAPPIAIATIPVVVDLLDALPVARWVYYCVDDFGQWPGLDGAALRTMEAALIERADVLIAVSEPLRTRLGRGGREVHLLTHGVELDLWSGVGGDTSAPPGIAAVEQPLITFWGLIDRRMDVTFLERLSSVLDKGTILLVGPESDPDPVLRRLDRVVLHPALPYRELPRLARWSGVLIMPYADLPVTRAMQPLKLKEYLATGRPAVVRDLPSTRPWADCLDLADTPEAFASAVRERLDTGLLGSQHTARARLAQEGWAEKAREWERWISGPEASAHVADDD